MGGWRTFRVTPAALACTLRRVGSDTVTSRRTPAPRTVPFFDLGPQHEHLSRGLLAELAELIDQSAFTNGPQVAQFEEAFAEFCGTSLCVGLASGLDALRLALLAAELETGDEVVVPAMTFVATIEAVTQAGGRPVMVDIGESDYCLDVDAAPQPLARGLGSSFPFTCTDRWPTCAPSIVSRRPPVCRSSRTRARRTEPSATGSRPESSVLPGPSASTPRRTWERSAMPEPWSRTTSTSLRECARSGSMGNARSIATRSRDIRPASTPSKRSCCCESCRPSSIGTAQRSEAARLYTAALAEVGDLRLPPVPDGSEPVWHLYVVRTGSPAQLQEHLAARGIGSGRHYPDPCHLAEAYGWLGYQRGAFPVAEALAAEALSLPLYPGISEGQIERVAEVVEDYFRGG